MNKTKNKIQWLNMPGYKGETWNYLLGCQKLSDGCRECYAQTQANIRAGNLNTKYRHVITNGEWNGKSFSVADALYKPLKWKKPRIIFVCSMGDLFFEGHSFQEIDKVFTVMASCPQHIFIVLTKRAKRMNEWFNWKDKSWVNEGMQSNDRIRYYCWHNYGVKINSEDWKWPLQNVWLGVSAENQEQANKRIPYLMRTPAAVCLVSIEPILGAIDFYDIQSGSQFHNVLTGVLDITTSQSGLLGEKLDWVIVGGESGYKARPAHPDWVRYVRDQCKAAGVPLFFKQWGEWLPATEVSTMMWVHPADWKGKHDWVNKSDGKNTHKGDGCMTVKVGRKVSGNMLDGVIYEEYPKK